MPRYYLRQDRDAYVVYEAEIEAEDPAAAIAAAEKDECLWVRRGVEQMDNRILRVFADPDDDEPLLETEQN